MANHPADSLKVVIELEHMQWNGIHASSVLKAASTEVREDFVKQHLSTSGPISFALHTSIPECRSHNGTPLSASDGSDFKPLQKAQQVLALLCPMSTAVQYCLLCLHAPCSANQLMMMSAMRCLGMYAWTASFSQFKSCVS